MDEEGALASWLVRSTTSGSGSSPGRGHCVVFLGKTLYSHSASLHPGVQKDTGQINAEGSPAMNCMSAFHPEGISLVV